MIYKVQDTYLAAFLTSRGFTAKIDGGTRVKTFTFELDMQGLELANTFIDGTAEAAKFVDALKFLRNEMKEHTNDLWASGRGK